MNGINLKWAKKTLAEKPGYKYIRNTGLTKAKRLNKDTGQMEEVDINFGEYRQVVPFCPKKILKHEM